MQDAGDQYWNKLKDYGERFERSLLTCWFYLVNLIVLGLAYAGTYFLANVFGIDTWVIKQINLPNKEEMIRHSISILISVLIVLPKSPLMWRYLRGEIKIYRLLVSLSKRFHETEGEKQHWKMLLKIIMLRLLGWQEYKFKTSVINYAHLHTAGAILARKTWISIYWAPIEYWAYLKSFLKDYISEVKVLPDENKKKYIISSNDDIERAFEDSHLATIFEDALETGAKTMVVYSDSPEFESISSSVMDCSLFDNLVMVYLSKDSKNELANVIAKLPDDADERMKELGKTKLNVVIKNKTGSVPIFEEINEGVRLLDALPSTVKKQVAKDQTTSNFILR